MEEDQISVESMFDGMDDDECCSEILNMHKDVELPFPVTDTDGGKNSDFLGM